MKPQDTTFLIVLVSLFLIRKPRLFVVIGLICLFLAIPLFSNWVFFTAQRLVYYGAAFLLSSIVVWLFKLSYEEKRK